MTDNDFIINFPAGLIGFPEIKEYRLLEPSDAYPLKFLQSVDQPELSFVAMDIAAIKLDFDASLSPEEAEILELTNPEDAMMIAFVVIPESESTDEMVANLAGPIIINKKNRKAIQLVLDNKKYPLQHPVFDLTVQFPAGLIGLPDLKRFRLFEPSGGYPLKFLQAVQQEEYSFVCMDVGAIKPDYDAPLTPEDAEFLAIEKPDDALVLALVVIPEDPRQMTANLAGPLIINKSTMKGRQLALDTEKFPLKYQIITTTKN
ncbi:MAG: flagellar assembly protein FliW [Holophagales bacterium]|jgi:flagellar assembly factor FliW|nr:flagellar assembly protein FliW [Holophagales bacterium]